MVHNWNTIKLSTYIEIVENYENEVAFRQGRLAHYLHSQLKTRRWWPNPFKDVCYTDVLEWVEKKELPKLMRWTHRKLHEVCSRMVYAVSILDDNINYSVALHLLRTVKKGEYDLTNEFYNWLVYRQEV